MKAAAFLCLVAVAVAALPAARGQADARPVQRLAWMAGCWQRHDAARSYYYEEQWLTPRGGLMIGAARTVRNDTAISYEHLRIYRRGSALIYAAVPSGQSPTEFTSIEITDSTVVFANPEHDFPQRILYRAAAGDSLHARIEGVRGGQTRGFDFRMARVSCEVVHGRRP